MKVFLGLETSSAEVELASAANYFAMVSDGIPVKKGNLHITIRYIGNITSVRLISELEETMDRICSRQKAFYLSVDCAAQIPGRDMVCALLNGDTGILDNLTRTVDREVVKMGYRKNSSRKYMPHVTLAYDLRREWTDEDIRLQKIPFLVSRLTLFESVYKNGETFFIPLYTSDFKG